MTDPAGELTIRPFVDDDWPQVWAVIEPVLRAGETFPFSPELDEEQAYHLWVTIPTATWIAEDGHLGLVGSYYLKPNQPRLGDHVCNCGYIVAEPARGRGIGGALCRHSQHMAPQFGFRAMQYNLVVTTNESAIRTWQRNGMTVVGRLPGAFRHPIHGHVDALIMYRSLCSPD